VPWGNDDTASVIDGHGAVTTYSIPEADGCIGPDAVGCVSPRADCEAGAEVVLGHDGQAIETVCYPKGDTLTVEEIEAQSGNVAQNQNNAVVALDAADDGADIEGDLAVDANNVVVYGKDPATSVIAGDVNVDGNNIIVRGVRIQGDVTIAANNAVFLHCVIEGNLVVTANNAVIAACDVFGSVELRGNNTKLAGNHLVGNLSDRGKNSHCEDNLSAHDTNGDFVLQSSELGAALSCGR
jgi:UDP-3-O-[3-hydroxymyristoyl] glucosamine N-acyltransferase